MPQTRLDGLVVRPALMTDEITGSWSGVPLQAIFEAAIGALKTDGAWIAEAEYGKGRKMPSP